MSNSLKRRYFIGNAVAVIAATASLSRTRDLYAANESAEHRIEIANFVFATETLFVKVGDKITWVNMDIVPHTATAKDRSWDTGLINSGDSATIVVSTNMEGSYFCEYHPTMIAQLNVAE